MKLSRVFLSLEVSSKRNNMVHVLTLRTQKWCQNEYLNFTVNTEVDLISKTKLHRCFQSALSNYGKQTLNSRSAFMYFNNKQNASPTE